MILLNGDVFIAHSQHTAWSDSKRFQAGPLSLLINTSVSKWIKETQAKQLCGGNTHFSAWQHRWTGNHSEQIVARLLKTIFFYAASIICHNWDLSGSSSMTPSACVTRMSTMFVFSCLGSSRIQSMFVCSALSFQVCLAIAHYSHPADTQLLFGFEYVGKRYYGSSGSHIGMVHFALNPHTPPFLTPNGCCCCINTIHTAHPHSLRYLTGNPLVNE